jgi:hypothetical protein
MTPCKARRAGNCRRSTALAFLGLVMASSSVHATDYVGKVVSVVSAVSPSTVGNVRVSIQLPATYGSPCTAYGGVWFSYDMPDGAVGKMWAATLLAAVAGGRDVSITGTGTCDAYGVEMVRAIGAI